jgi:hypothetical protein
VPLLQLEELRQFLPQWVRHAIAIQWGAAREAALLAGRRREPIEPRGQCDARRTRPAVLGPSRRFVRSCIEKGAPGGLRPPALPNSRARSPPCGCERECECEWKAAKGNPCASHLRLVRLARSSQPWPRSTLPRPRLHKTQHRYARGAPHKPIAHRQQKRGIAKLCKRRRRTVSTLDPLFVRCARLRRPARNAIFFENLLLPSRHLADGAPTETFHAPSPQH